jgi:hypothetical protein
MQLVVDPCGGIRGVYAEDLDLARLGRVAIHRGSHVEPTADGRWTADLAPVGGPVLGPFRRRSEAVAAERTWLDRWLTSTDRRADQRTIDRAVARATGESVASIAARGFVLDDESFVPDPRDPLAPFDESDGLDDERYLDWDALDDE